MPGVAEIVPSSAAPPRRTADLRYAVCGRIVLAATDIELHEYSRR